MIACAHQPNYLPWLGFFHKLSHSDCFICLDSVQFPQKCWTNRVQIAGAGPRSWLTVPVKLPHGQKTPINQVEIDTSIDWSERHLRTLRARYGRAPHFREIFAQLEELLGQPTQSLLELNLRLIEWACRGLGIQPKVAMSSQLASSGASSELLAGLCRAVGASTYVAGEGAIGYDIPQVYEELGVKYSTLSYERPIYAQHSHGPFEAGLSTIDALFSVGFAGTAPLVTSRRRAHAS